MKIFIAILFCFLQTIGISQITRTYLCILRSNSQIDTLYDGTILPIFGITNSLSAYAKIPAKTLYAELGDSVVLEARSISQGEHHTIHLHGLDVDTRNDGDPATSFWLEHMDDTTYSFNATNTGLYIYHCHAADVVHVEMGMYGMIVVTSHNGTNYEMWPGGPIYHKSYNWLLSELDSSWNYNPPFHDPIMDTVRIPEYNPSHFLINGKGNQELLLNDSIRITGNINEYLVLRIGSIGYTTNRIVFPSGLNHEILMSDGRPLPNALIEDTLYLMPGERYEIRMQASDTLSDSIQVFYDNMNTGSNHGSWKVPVEIKGVLSVSEPNNDYVNIYPNPAENFLSINSENSFSFKIIDIAGKYLFGSEILSTNLRLDIGDLKSGLYFINLEFESGIRSFKFVKK